MKIDLLFLLLYNLSIYITCATGSIKSINGALRMVKVIVPPYSVSGETVSLQCNYELGNNNLYSVKWYKDNEEFFRFVPRMEPRVTSYAVEGVNVDIMKSNSRKVVLNPVTWKSSGVYKCEVSAEAPSFSSAQSESIMEVIVFPDEDPMITPKNAFYKVGSKIFLNCTFGKSHPPSILQWYINGQQVVNPDSLIHYPPINHQEGLYSTTLGLKFTLENGHFKDGSMNIKCLASLSTTYPYSNTEIVVRSSSEMREALLLVKSSSTTYMSSTVFPFYSMVILIFLQTVV